MDWKEEHAYYSGRYAVVQEPDCWWHAWLGIRYLGRYPTPEQAKEACEQHAKERMS